MKRSAETLERYFGPAHGRKERRCQAATSANERHETTTEQPASSQPANESADVTPQQRERAEVMRRQALAIRALNNPSASGQHREYSSPPAVADLLTETSWRDALSGSLDGPPGHKIDRLLKDEIAAGASVYPPQKHIFRALNETPLHNVKVVIMGQDPYPNEGQAEGFSFSVPDGVQIPKSLQNILSEVSSDFKVSSPRSGHLGKWARQGVLLLNAVLTVQAGKPRSHSKQGWEAITAQAIREVSKRRDGAVFLLWGKDAQQKKQSIDTSKHLVLEAPHPSPLSASKGFFGCRHFSQANRFLQEKGQEPIDWRLNE
jgi:uracil-DNA glycosylase